MEGQTSEMDPLDDSYREARARVADYAHGE